MLIGVVDAAATRELRRAVLRPHLSVGEPLPGDELADAVHLAACDDNGTVVGTCFVYADRCPWLPNRDNSWHLRQMATEPTRRGQGVGSAVLRASIDYLRIREAELVWCYARERATTLYARQGFRPHGAVFTDDDHAIPHLRMWLELAGGSVSS